jgi:hypothetical protein
VDTAQRAGWPGFPDGVKGGETARRLGLPAEPARLARLVGDADLPAFAAGLVRAALDAKLARRVTGG